MITHKSEICEFLNVFASLYRFYAPKYAAVKGLHYPNIGAIAYDHGINSMAAAQSLLAKGTAYGLYTVRKAK
ncbi:MAG: hypothetical protein U9O54_00745, partial [Chloroflexota bacterium]|nr:hypothetical protein [Chloroflexota bacterium]